MFIDARTVQLHHHRRERPQAHNPSNPHDWPYLGSGSGMSSSSHGLPYPRSPNLSVRSYNSSPMSSATSPRASSLQPSVAGLLHSTPRTGSLHPPPQPIGIPPPLPSQLGFQPYTPMTTGSTMGRDSLPSSESGPNTPGQSVAVLASSGPVTNAQKRAYRQRRKDPSCDACRERKVKCDATETTSCSECSSRNVKCQFTKETNRRMSSIKQVQDLEKQMERMRKENIALKHLLQDRDGHADVDMDGLEQLPLQLPGIGTDPKRKKRPSPRHDLGRARANMESFSKGIWKPPPPFRHDAKPSSFRAARPEVPPREITEQLLHSYYSAVHVMFPILHWPTFQQRVDELYATADHWQIPSAWLSMFFSVLAAGALFSNSPQIDRFYRPANLLEEAMKQLDPWNNDHNLESARALALITVCLNEMNLKTAAWTWLGSAIRIAQDLGLYQESGPWPVIEGEMRKRIWWTLYVLDRSLALELGRPVTIDDEDCDVGLPAAVDDHHIREMGIQVPQGKEPLTHFLHAIIHAVRSYTALIRTLRDPVVATTRLATFDQHFRSCLLTFPAACDPSNTVPLAPHYLLPLVYLLSARLLLHRHNLNPSCPPDVRVAAVEQCYHTASETAGLISRTSGTLAEGATALFTVHAFRCALFLLLVGDLEAAATCVRVLAATHTRRDVAIPCGRFLAFFVSALAAKRAEYTAVLARSTPAHAFGRGPATLQDCLMRDEEVLAYVSSDLQGSSTGSWVWSGAEHELRPSPEATRQGAPGSSSAGSSLLSAEQRIGLTSEENNEWGGWDRLESAIKALLPGAGVPTPTSATWGSAAMNHGPGAVPIKLEPGSSGGLANILPPPTPGTGGRVSPTVAEGPAAAAAAADSLAKYRNQERISIANII